MSTSELAPTLKDFVSEIAEAQEIPEGMLQNQFERQMGIDLTEVSDEDAQRFVDAIEEDKFDSACDVLRDYGADDDSVETFREQMETIAEQQEENGDGETGNSTSEQSSETSGGLSEAEIDQKIQQATPTADEIANSLKDQLGGAVSGGGGNGQPQQQEGEQLGQLISLARLFADSGGGGAMSEMGEKATERVMERTMQRLAEPSFGERIGKAIEQQVAEDVADNVSGDVDLEFGQNGEGLNYGESE